MTMTTYVRQSSLSGGDESRRGRQRGGGERGSCGESLEGCRGGGEVEGGRGVGQKEGTVAQKTIPMFACFSLNVVVSDNS